MPPELSAHTGIALKVPATSAVTYRMLEPADYSIARIERGVQSSAKIDVACMAFLPGENGKDLYVLGKTNQNGLISQPVAMANISSALSRGIAKYEQHGETWYTLEYEGTDGRRIVLEFNDQIHDGLPKIPAASHMAAELKYIRSELAIPVSRTAILKERVTVRAAANKPEDELNTAAHTLLHDLQKLGFRTDGKKLDIRQLAWTTAKFSLGLNLALLTLPYTEYLPYLDKEMQLAFCAIALIGLANLGSVAKDIFHAGKKRNKIVLETESTPVLTILTQLTTKPAHPTINTTNIRTAEIQGGTNDIIVAYVEPFQRQSPPNFGNGSIGGG